MPRTSEWGRRYNWLCPIRDVLGLARGQSVCVRCRKPSTSREHASSHFVRERSGDVQENTRGAMQRFAEGARLEQSIARVEIDASHAYGRSSSLRDRGRDRRKQAHIRCRIQLGEGRRIVDMTVMPIIWSTITRPPFRHSRHRFPLCWIVRLVAHGCSGIGWQLARELMTARRISAMHT